MANEVETYAERIDDLLQQIESLLADTPDEALNWRPLESSDAHEMNSLAVLATHVAGAARFWSSEVVAGAPATRDRPAEFETVGETSAQLVQLIQATRAEVKNVLGQLHPGELDGVRQVRDRTFTVRWSIVHIIDHTALHLGHMQITYQLWNGRGVDAPRWFQRINNE